jgi:hypothetical protein
MTSPDQGDADLWVVDGDHLVLKVAQIGSESVSEPVLSYRRVCRKCRSPVKVVRKFPHCRNHGALEKYDIILSTIRKV